MSAIRHETYMNQLKLRKPGGHSHEMAMEESKVRRERERKTPYVAPNTEELLEMVGGDTRMTWVKGASGMEIRNILTLRAMHVKERLLEKAIEDGRAKRVHKTFYQTDILPMIHDNYIASSSEEEEEREERERLERKAERQKRRDQKKQQGNKMDQRESERAALRAERLLEKQKLMDNR